MSSDVTVPAPHRATITLSDVAREAGVSIATASFVLSGRGGSRSAGSPATKAKVRAAAGGPRVRPQPQRPGDAHRPRRGHRAGAGHAG